MFVGLGFFAVHFPLMDDADTLVSCIQQSVVAACCFLGPSEIELTVRHCEQ